MFVVITLEDNIWLFPQFFADGKAVTTDDENREITKELQARYVDRIVPDNGLCMAVYDIVKIGDAVIHSTDNKNYMSQAEFKVTFKLAVFRPFVGEWLEADILVSTDQGITASMGFFATIFISAANLHEPAVFTNGTWMWLYHDPEDETARPVKFYYETGRKIRFKVLNVIYGSDPDPPMKILGGMNEQGLGGVAWW